MAPKAIASTVGLRRLKNIKHGCVKIPCVNSLLLTKFENINMVSKVPLEVPVFFVQVLIN